MAAISTWSTTANNNNSTPPDGWPEGQAPSTVNDCAREMMAAIRRQMENAAWFDFGHDVSYASSTTFKVATDVTALYETDRRVKLIDAVTIYATITGSSYSAPDTTVTVTPDSSSITASLASASLSILEKTKSALPNDNSATITTGKAIAMAMVFG